MTHPPHFLAVPFPLSGHISPMLQLCKFIAHHGLAITFISTDRNQPNLLLDETWSGLDIRFASIPDELPADFQLTDLDTLRKLLRAVENLKAPFRQLMEELTSAAAPSFSCIISDVHLGWTQDVAQEFGLPRIALWTSNMTELCTYFHVPELVARGYIPLRSNRDSSDLHDDDPACNIVIPGLPILQIIDLPYFLRIATDCSDILFRYFVEQTSRITEAKHVLVNSFNELEQEAFDALKRSYVSNIVPVGPLMLLGENIAADARSSAKFHEDEEIKCLEWLDGQASSSVVYVALGSVSCIAEAQVLEFASGLEMCGHPFLWVVRPGLAKGIDGNPLSETYLAGIRAHSLVVSWAPQVRILAHSAVGCFVTHCGWNSTLESICAGVPMVCWPISADQPLTCKLIKDQWKVGVRMGKEAGAGLTRAEEVEMAVKTAMRDLGTLKARALELQDASEKACISSSCNLDHILESFCCSTTTFPHPPNACF